VADREIIPVIDLGPYLAGAVGSIDRTAGELRFAMTEVGFYLIVNHGVRSGTCRRNIPTPEMRTYDVFGTETKDAP
jgi:isopenicillin N synthase-like dioxygenase